MGKGEEENPVELKMFGNFESSDLTTNHGDFLFILAMNNTLPECYKNIKVRFKREKISVRHHARQHNDTQILI